jgi:hypothetical protein
MALTFSPQSSPPRLGRTSHASAGVLVDPRFLLDEPLYDEAVDAQGSRDRQTRQVPLRSSGRGPSWWVSTSGLLTLLIAMLMAVVVISAFSTRADAAAPDREWVVAEGESLWAIARELQPRGDVRPLVQRLTVLHGTSAVHPGDRIVIPADLSHVSE